MQAVVGNSLLKALKPKAKPFEIRDTQLKGLILRVQPSGRMTYFLEYERGKRFKLGVHPGMTPSIAREVAKETLAKVYKGFDPIAEKKQDKKAHTLKSFVEEVYLPWAKINLRSFQNTSLRVSKVFAEFYDKKMQDITPWMVEKWRSNRLKSGRKPVTVNRDLTDLKSMMAKAKMWGFVKEHPLRDVKRCRVDNSPKVRFLTEDEEARLRVALDDREETICQRRDRYNKWRTKRHFKPLLSLRKVSYADHLKPLVLLSLNTGMRRGELFNLKWQDVDLDLKLLTVDGESSKSGKTRHIPLNTEAYQVLQCWRNHNGGQSEYVFPGDEDKPLDNVNKPWREVLSKAGVKNFRWHDMRHTFASNLSMAGVDLNTIRELLGHSSYQMTLRYAHLAPKHKAEAVAKLVRC